MYCQKCGNELSDDDNFCGKCGAKVSNGKFNDNHRHIAVLIRKKLKQLSLNDDTIAEIHWQARKFFIYAGLLLLLSIYIYIRYLSKR